MKINKDNLDTIIGVKNQQVVNNKKLTNKVIQFGTGVLLRGLPDYYIHQANQKGAFDAGIVVIKSTKQGDINDFKNQDNLYSIQTEGIQNAKVVQYKEIVTCISKVLTATEDWKEIIELAKDPDIEFIISNTTEAGIIEVEEKIGDVPTSYPGRLVALLYQRYLHFQADPKKGFIILPTELIDKNADRLRQIVISIASKNNLSQTFIDWIAHANHFCNTLVDRIVPGKVDSSNWDYEDNLAIAVEPFNLWAIEVTDSIAKKKLAPLAKYNPGIKIMDSLESIKELKLRLLNASHTLLCPISILAQKEFVRETMQDLSLEKWTEEIMQTEITEHLLTRNLSESEINEFASSIIDRFKNPFIDHKWLAIAQNSTQKWQQRIIPILQSWNAMHDTSSERIALSMAAYLKCNQLFSENQFPIDSQIKIALNYSETVSDILANKNIWATDLSTNNSFVALVNKYFQELSSKSILQIIKQN